MTIHDKRERGDKYVLVIQHKDFYSRKYFSDEHDLNCYATFIPFSAYVARYRGMVLRGKKWVELFRLG